MASDVIRVAVVDDHPVARWGVEHLLARCPRVEVVCSVGSVAELEDAGADPDVVILDLYLSGDRPAVEVVGSLSARYRVLVMSASGRRADVLAAVRAGADGYLTKRSDGEMFLDAIARVAAGGFYLSSRLADIVHADLDGRHGSGGQPRLTAREEEALRYIAQGLTHAQAATRMGVQTTTVDTYIKRIRAKLGLGNKAELTRKAIELAQLDDDPPG
jgi:two-component system, NarL family, nitrate/nitrite response regulator NarL